jgi:putative addiction module killer protein
VEARPREILIFQTEDGKVPFSDWIAAYEEDKISSVLVGRIERIEEGNFGDCEPVGEGVVELRIHAGPGYRIYFGQDGDLVVLLWGGIKKTQKKDLEKAKKYWSQYNA